MNVKLLNNDIQSRNKKRFNVILLNVKDSYIMKQKKFTLLFIIIFGCLIARMYMNENTKKKAVQLIVNRFESVDNLEPSKDSLGPIQITMINELINNK